MHKTNFMTKRVVTIFAGLLIAFTGVAFLATKAVHADDTKQLKPAQTYTQIYMPATDLTTISYDIKLENVPKLGSEAYFWSRQFGFTKAPENGGAYIGLQGTNKIVFSVFNWPSPKASPRCKVLTTGFDEGLYDFGGTSCIAQYTLTQGHSYRVTVQKVGTDSLGNNWEGSVTDLNTGSRTVIATINVPTSWGDISDSSSVWTEYFDVADGKLKRGCEEMPPSAVTFSNFTAINSKGTYAIKNSTSKINETLCSNYSAISDNGKGSITQIIGVKNAKDTVAALAPQTTPDLRAEVPCPPSKTFFGLPAWYKYLPCQLDGNPKFRQLSDVWLVGLGIIDILLRLAGVAAVIFVMYGGFRYITSQGEPEATNHARSIIIGAVVGLIVAILAIVIVSFVGSSLG